MGVLWGAPPMQVKVEAAAPAPWAEGGQEAGWPGRNEGQSHLLEGTWFRQPMGKGSPGRGEAEPGTAAPGTLCRLVRRWGHQERAGSQALHPGLASLLNPQGTRGVQPPGLVHSAATHSPVLSAAGHGCLRLTVSRRQ